MAMVNLAEAGSSPGVVYAAPAHPGLKWSVISGTATFMVKLRCVRLVARRLGRRRQERAIMVSNPAPLTSTWPARNRDAT